MDKKRLEKYFKNIRTTFRIRLRDKALKFSLNFFHKGGTDNIFWRLQDKYLSSYSDSLLSKFKKKNNHYRYMF